MKWLGLDFIMSLPVSVRCGLSFASAALMVLLTARWFIKQLRRLQCGQAIFERLPASHQRKTGTPTMGGLLIAIVSIISGLYWTKWSFAVAILLVTLVAFAVIGWCDDWLKVKRRHNRGISAHSKLLAQIIAAIGIVALLYYLDPTISYAICLPWRGAELVLPSWLWSILAVLVIVGSSNAVNLTDGLDGLALSSVVTALAALAVIAYKFDHRVTGEISVWLSAVVGTGVGLLNFNCHPARVFIGDVGSLSLGAIMAVAALLLHQPLLLLLIGGVFVIETLSVILQVGSYRLTGRRIFRMAPIHHHFELLGFKEPTIVWAAWLLTVLLSLISLGLLLLSG